MNDILICIRPHGRCLVLGETDKGKRWIQDNMITEGGSVWISREGVDEVVEQMRTAEMLVEVM